VKKAVLTLDCGATNVKASVTDATGHIESSYSISNRTIADPYYPGGLIWDINEIVEKLILCAGKAASVLSQTDIIAVTITSFGVDGAPVKKDGTLCYPVISWQCQRTEEIQKNTERYFDKEWLYQNTGLQPYHFNTINKLIWFRENRPDVLESMDYFAFVPSLIAHYFTGEFATDITMAGTSMLTEIRNRRFSQEVLQKIGLNADIFPSVSEPGKVIGIIRSGVASACGIPQGIPVLSAGHDTQFALLGACAMPNQPVLSSGTWEILMVRSEVQKIKFPLLKSGITTEFDVVPGMADSGIQWVASGMIEWITELLFNSSEEKKSLYEAIIAEAARVEPGCNGLTVIPEIYPGGLSKKRGTISGFTHHSTRHDLYRATLESMSYYLRQGMTKLGESCNFSLKNIICTGGGSKNALWNQIRADVLGVPVKVPEVSEATALGAAITALITLGVYNNTDEAMSVFSTGCKVYEPGQNAQKYQDLCRKYIGYVFNE
jgi:L-fuculokinase